MPETHPALRIPITIEAWLGSSPELGPALHSTVATFLARLFADLEIPAGAELTISELARWDRDCSPPFRLSIAGVRCRLNREYPFQSAVTSEQLAAAISQAILENRALLLSAELIRAALRSVPGSVHRVYGEQEVGAVRAALQRGIPLGSAGSLVDQRAATADESELEEELAEPELFVDLSPERYKLLNAQGGASGTEAGKTIDELTQLVRLGLFYELGTLMGKVHIRPDASLRGAAYTFSLNRLRGPTLPGLELGTFLVNGSPERIALLGLRGTAVINLANLVESTCVDGEAAQLLCKAAGLTTWNPTDYLILTLAAFARKNMAFFLTAIQVEYLLAMLAKVAPRLVGIVMERLPTARLLHVLRGLVAEGVSIRHLKLILEALLELHEVSHVVSVDESIAHVRIRLGRQLCQSLRKDKTLICWILDQELEDRLAAEATTPLDTEEAEALRDTLASELGCTARLGDKRILLTSDHVRRTLRILTSVELPSIAILGYQEVACDETICPIGRVALPR